MLLYIVCKGYITFLASVVQEWLTFAILRFVIGCRLTTVVQINNPLGFFNMVIFLEEQMGGEGDLCLDEISPTLEFSKYNWGFRPNSWGNLDDNDTKCIM